MTPRLSTAAHEIPGSATVGLGNAPAVHPETLSLAIGEPFGPPPPAAVEAAVRCAGEGASGYGPPGGIGALKEQLAHDQGRRTGLDWATDQVLVTVGGKAALLDGMRCMLEPGDEVLVPAPYWPSFLDQVRWAGGRPRVVPPGEDLQVDVAALEAMVGPRTRAVIVNDPINPTSRTWGAERLAAVAELAMRHDLWLVVDQVYAALVLDAEPCTLLEVAPEVRERTLVVESFSKRFALCGMRLGAALGPRPLIAAMSRLASATVTHPCLVAQHAGLAALEHGRDWVRERNEDYRRLRAIATGAIEAIEVLDCPRPESAFYLFPRLRSAAGALPGDDEVAARLLREHGLRVLPGSIFGAPGHLRLCYAADESRLRAALGRLDQGLSAIAAA